MLLMALAIWVGAKTEISFGHQPPIALRPAPAPERFNIPYSEPSGPTGPCPFVIAPVLLTINGGCGHSIFAAETSSLNVPSSAFTRNTSSWLPEQPEPPTVRFESPVLSIFPVSWSATTVDAAPLFRLAASPHPLTPPTVGNPSHAARRSQDSRDNGTWGSG